MPDITTENYDFTLPEEYASDDTWGAKLNANWAALDLILEDIQTQINDISAGVPAGVPAGVIVKWKGSVGTIPEGWALCDGTAGTLDLRGQFIIGAGGAYAVGDTGGAATVTLTEAQLPSHAHAAGTLAADSGGAHSHTASTGGAGGHSHAVAAIQSGGSSPLTGAVVTNPANSAGTISTSGVGDHSHSVTVNSGGAHTHTISGSTGTIGAGEAHNNLPPYYALCFIEKL